METSSPPFTVERPDPSLLRYYVLFSLCFLIAAPVVFTVLLFRYRTLRYRFDEEGISMAWGALRRREVNLTYGRIQDIHLTSNAIERWLGLAKIQIQTASGSHKPEMTIEGVREFEALRSFLERRMRQERVGGDDRGDRRVGAVVGLDNDAIARLAAHLKSTTTELRRLRAALEGRQEGVRDDG